MSSGRSASSILETNEMHVLTIFRSKCQTITCMKRTSSDVAPGNDKLARCVLQFWREQPGFCPARIIIITHSMPSKSSPVGSGKSAKSKYSSLKSSRKLYGSKWLGSHVSSVWCALEANGRANSSSVGAQSVNQAALSIAT